MTRKVATAWKSNPSKNVNVPTYSSSSVQYNSSTTSYSSPTIALDEFNKTAGSWSKGNKTATPWKPNPAATTSQYVYDSAVFVYDSASQTYDGVVSGQDLGDIQTPTAWGEL